MYYITSRNHSNGDMIIWRQVKRLKDFKAEDGFEYIVARNERERRIERGTSLPIYIGLNGKLKKCSSYALYLF